MEKNEATFTEDIYSEHLAIIHNVRFTPREIDIIACLLNARRTSQIASILSISPRTVTTHFRNIMQRLSCGSQEGIISFIEQSHKISFLREYYASLIIEKTFHKSLQQIARFQSAKVQNCVIVYWNNSDLKNFLIRYLTLHLSQIRINAEIQEQRLDQNIGELIVRNHVLLLFIEKGEDQEVHQNYANLASVDLRNTKNYYFAVFEIIKKIIPDVNFDNIYQDFIRKLEEYHSFFGNRNTYSTLNNSLPISYIFYNKYKKKLFLVGFIFIIIFCFLCIDKLKIIIKEYYSVINNTTIPKPNLKIPCDKIILERPELISRIDKFLRSYGGIQVVMLVGMGGVGKTTLAHCYANLYKDSFKHSIIWEINAENIKSIEDSFKKFAYQVAKTISQRETLDYIQKIADKEYREKQYLSFIKDFLKEHSKWLLIYDNVVDFSEISDYFPQDVDMWGEGKVIITTRDGNLKNINNEDCEVIKIDEIQTNQALILLKKILEFQENRDQKKEALQFLNNIPLFPLDISVAAHYIKNEKLTYRQYLDRLNQHSKEFRHYQKKLLTSIDGYSQTRYDIAISSIKSLIKDPLYKELIFFIMLIDSQNIPKKLLEEHSKNNVKVDLFLNSLRSNSIVKNELSHNHIKREILFSIHNCTQPIILRFLNSELTPEEIKEFLERILKTIKSYYDSYALNDPFQRAFLTLHLKMILKNLNELRILERNKKKYKEIISSMIYACTPTGVPTLQNQ